MSTMTCPCGHPVILADTDEWVTPRCFDCWHAMTADQRQIEAIDGRLARAEKALAVAIRLLAVDTYVEDRDDGRELGEFERGRAR